MDPTPAHTRLRRGGSASGRSRAAAKVRPWELRPWALSLAAVVLLAVGLPLPATAAEDASFTPDLCFTDNRGFSWALQSFPTGLLDGLLFGRVDVGADPNWNVGGGWHATFIDPFFIFGIVLIAKNPDIDPGECCQFTCSGSGIDPRQLDGICLSTGRCNRRHGCGGRISWTTSGASCPSAR